MGIFHNELTISKINAIYSPEKYWKSKSWLLWCSVCACILATLKNQ